MSVVLYIHVPFCVHKCNYCDFASGVFSGLDPAHYIKALLTEMKLDPDLQSGIDPKTVFIGGGTPSLLEEHHLKALLEGVASWVRDPLEWTVEANPGSLTTAKARLMRDLGVTRLSLGVQSLDPGELRFLERSHGPKEAHRAMEIAQDIFPGSWSADLIYAVPGQTEETWGRSLAGILSHNPSHMSGYELTWEPTTVLGAAQRRGETRPEPEEKILQQQQQAVARLAEAGLERYEISNWSIPGAHSRHNDHVWQGGDFLAFGNGAHGRLGDRRFRRTASPVDYVQRIETGLSAVVEEEWDATVEDRLATCLLLGLRRRDGIPFAVIQEITGSSVHEIWPDLLQRWGTWLAIESNHLKATAQGWNVLDRVLLEMNKTYFNPAGR